MQQAIERYQQYRNSHKSTGGSSAPIPSLPLPRVPCTVLPALSQLDGLVHSNELHKIALSILQAAVGKTTCHSASMLHSALAFLVLALRQPIASVSAPVTSNLFSSLSHSSMLGEGVGGFLLSVLVGANASSLPHDHIVVFLASIIQDADYVEQKVLPSF